MTGTSPRSRAPRPHEPSPRALCRQPGPPPTAPDPCGGAAPSSTRSTCAASPTATATGPVTSRASAPRLPYLQDLGVDAIWFTPWYVSPLADGGYDVADYRGIDPAFGTLDEAEALIAEALALGIRTIVDVVPNHVSDRHAWFQAALAAGPGSPRARALLVPPRPRRRRRRAADRLALRVPGRRTWTRTTNPDGTPGDWYLHLFTPEQPDLNWDHPDVRARARGRSSGSGSTAAPAACGSTRPPCSSRTRRCPRSRRVPAPGRAPAPRPRRAPRHLPRAGAPSPTPIRARASSSARSGSPDIERFAQYLRPDELHTAFNFDFMARPWDAASLRASIDETLALHAPVGAPATWVLSNHDVTRPVTRYGREDSSFAFARASGSGSRRTSTSAGAGPGPLRCSTAALPGSLYIYQGDELGLDEVEVPVARDPGPDARALRRRRPGPRRLPRAAALERRRGAVRVQPRRRVGAALAEPARPLVRADRRGAARRPGLDAPPLSGGAARPARRPGPR